MINVSIPTSLIIVISCVVLFIIIGIIAYIIYKDKKNDDEEINDLIHDIVNAKPRKEKEVKKQESPIKVTQVSPKSSLNLEEMLGQMQSDLDKRHNVIDEYEKSQDENAIISIKELERQADNSNNIEAYEKEQEEESIISVNDLKLNGLEKLEKEEDEMKKPLNKAISRIENHENNKKFKSTDFISPIFGKMDQKPEYPKVKAYNKEADLSINEYFGEDVEKDFNKSIDTKPLNNEMEKNIEFLNALKEFRNNL